MLVTNQCHELITSNILAPVPLLQSLILIHLHDSPLTLIAYGLKGCLDIIQ